jgi:hypothetical protein
MQAVERLMRLAGTPERFDIPWSELQKAQLAAVDERLQQGKQAIGLVRHRAAEGNIESVRSLEDIVPLLFAHMTYKSYPESWLLEQRWDRMTRWLATVSAHPVKGVDLNGITGIDDWIERLERAGHFVSCSSGTTGKSAMLNASKTDMEWVGRDSVSAISWATGIEPARDRHIFRLSPVASVPRNITITEAIGKAFGDPQWEPFRYPVPPITIGKITSMVALRKAISEGTAKPNEIAAYDAMSKEREQAFDAAIGTSAQALVAARSHKLFIVGMWASLYKIAEAVRALGSNGKDFHADNAIYVGGGLKGAVLPENYREFIFETFNIRPERVFQLYGMQEINCVLPRCSAGRYHAPPWLVCLPLDEPGEKLLPIREGEEIEGRAAFFDVSLDGRWGGVISGDRIQVRFGPCECGHEGPSVRDNITRYVELTGSDKISCSGTIDAYVRGVA